MTKVSQDASHFPYVGDREWCDLCGRLTDELRYVELEPARVSRDGSVRMARGIWVCGDHEIAATR